MEEMRKSELLLGKRVFLLSKSYSTSSMGGSENLEESSEEFYQQGGSSIISISNYTYNPALTSISSLRDSADSPNVLLIPSFTDPSCEQDQTIFSDPDPHLLSLNSLSCHEIWDPQHSINYPPNFAPTEKKDFVSDINPHQLKRNFQRDKCVWLGAYDTFLLHANLLAVLPLCDDPSPPLECVAIHVANLNLVFAEVKGNVRAFVQGQKDSAILLKLYLLSIEQFSFIVEYITQTKLSIQCPNLLDSIQHIIGGRVEIESKSAYKEIMYMGSLEELPILSVSRSIHPSLYAKPRVDYVHRMFMGLQESFTPYSEHFLLYYLYLRPGMKGRYSPGELAAVCRKNRDEEDIYMKGELQAFHTPSPGGWGSVATKCTTGTSVDEGTAKGELALGTHFNIQSIQKDVTFTDETLRCSTFLVDAEGDPDPDIDLSLQTPQCPSQIDPSLWLSTHNKYSFNDDVSSINTDPLLQRSQADDPQHKRRGSGTFIEEISSLLKEIETNMTITENSMQCFESLPPFN